MTDIELISTRVAYFHIDLFIFEASKRHFGCGKLVFASSKKTFLRFLLTISKMKEAQSNTLENMTI